MKNRIGSYLVSRLQRVVAASAGQLKPAARWVPGALVAWMLGVGVADATPVTFAFTDGSTFDNKVADGTISQTLSGITLTSLSATVPTYTIIGAGPTYDWDGTYSTGAMTNISGANGLAVNSHLLTNNGDASHFNPGESWTIAFDVPVIFRTIDGQSVDNTDAMRVAFGSSTFDFLGTVEFAGSGDILNDPFGPTTIIPANTNITFTNISVPPFDPYDSSASSENVWRLDGLTVEMVPEPSSIVLIGTTLLGMIAVAGRNKFARV